MNSLVNHIPVLLEDILEYLNKFKISNGIIIDATFGLGGYSNAFLEKTNCNVFGFDRDPDVKKYASKLKNIPGYIIQGRYDLICPPVNAYNLSQKWVGSKLKIINTAGHSSSDEGIMENMQYSLEQLIKAI